MASIFPFTAIVGQERMKRALILNAIYPMIGGVLIRGERGTAKSTAARALAALLPEIEVVADCRFQCDPNRPDTFCDECRARVERGETLPVARRRTRFVDLPVSATEDRVVGTLDIEKAIQRGERHFEPGILAAANRGVLYVDEVNLLDDHVVDLLLDSAAMGVNVVEREGISFSHPARFVLVGSMNPEEGDLRPQLLDRFALSVDIHGLMDANQRVQILERRIQFEQDPEGFCARWRAEEEKLSREIALARERLDMVTYTRRDLYTIAQLTAELHVDGHRADIVILKTARAHAAFEGRLAINERDILLAAELALPHRLKRQPFQDSSLEFEQLRERLEHAQAKAQQRESQLNQAEPSMGDIKKNELTGQSEEAITEDLSSAMVLTLEPVDQRSAEGRDHSAHRPVEIGRTFVTRRLDTPLDRLTRQKAGKRSRTRTERKRGRYVRARPANGQLDDIAFDATLRQAAPYQRRRRETAQNPPALIVRKEDLQRKLRVRRAANLVLFVVDASWSMAAAERMEATKGAIMSLLRDAYQRRDQVGLIVFQKDRARLVLPPTSSVELAQRALKDIPVGGKTPLSSGLLLAYQVCMTAKRRDPEIMPLIILLTDGAGNVSIAGLPAQEEALRVADLLRQAHLRSVVINMEHAAFDRGLAQSLAIAMGAPCYSLPDLEAESLLRTVRDELPVTSWPIVRSPINRPR
ncbi:MAG: putative cobaltochelatase [Anaerolineae bacterium]|nr:putative cobaltochelatase [Anaerolineae bacterium]MDW8099671.1 putative cobaltochelatase [Anaerolineae bacterium]